MQGNPRIRFHGSTLYALPYDVRSEFSGQNALLRQIDADFWASIRQRAKTIAPGLSAEHEAMIENAIAFSLTKTFEQQGLNLMASMQQGVDSFEEIRTYEFIRESLSAETRDVAVRQKLEEIAADVPRKVFYSGTDTENQYMFRLFKLYSIDFLIRGDEKVWRYFRNIVRNLKWLVPIFWFVPSPRRACSLTAK
jgi:glutathionylspermidine synthase